MCKGLCWKSFSHKEIDAWQLMSCYKTISYPVCRASEPGSFELFLNMTQQSKTWNLYHNLERITMKHKCNKWYLILLNMMLSDILFYLIKKKQNKNPWSKPTNNDFTACSLKHSSKSWQYRFHFCSKYMARSFPHQCLVPLFSHLESPGFFPHFCKGHQDGSWLKSIF